MVHLPITSSERRSTERVKQMEQYVRDQCMQVERRVVKEMKHEIDDHILKAFERVVHPLEKEVKDLRDQREKLHSRINAIAVDDKKVANKLKSVDMNKFGKFDPKESHDKAVKALDTVQGLEKRIIKLESGSQTTTIEPTQFGELFNKLDNARVQANVHLQYQLRNLQSSNSQIQDQLKNVKTDLGKALSQDARLPELTRPEAPTQAGTDSEDALATGQSTIGRPPSVDMDQRVDGAISGPQNPFDSATKVRPRPSKPAVVGSPLQLLLSYGRGFAPAHIPKSAPMKRLRIEMDEAESKRLSENVRPLVDDFVTPGRARLESSADSAEHDAVLAKGVAKIAEMEACLAKVIAPHAHIPNADVKAAAVTSEEAVAAEPTKSCVVDSAKLRDARVKLSASVKAAAIAAKTLQGQQRTVAKLQEKVERATADLKAMEASSAGEGESRKESDATAQSSEASVAKETPPDTSKALLKSKAKSGKSEQKTLSKAARRTLHRQERIERAKRDLAQASATAEVSKEAASDGKQAPNTNSPADQQLSSGDSRKEARGRTSARSKPLAIPAAASQPAEVTTNSS